jgi:anthranilate phosphoribosyltransferase
MILRDLLRVLGSHRRDGRNLTSEEAYGAFSTLLSGAESEIQVGAFLIALRWKGVTVEELVGFARAARERATIPCQGIKGLVTLCPPHEGYDHTPPLEVAAGLIAAAAGVRVLIISDRCVPPRRGVTAISVLEHIGCGATWDPAEVEDWVAKARFGAIALSGMLPAMLGLRRVRNDIGVRTPLSTVEKLIAPTDSALVLGAQGGPVLGTAVEVIQSLGHRSGMAIQGLEGGPVPTVRRRTRGIHLDGSHQIPMTIEPADFGLSCSEDAELPMFGPPDEGQGTGDNAHLVRAAADSILAVLAGEGGPARQSALMSAAVILRTARIVPTFAEGVDRATEALDSGAAHEQLARVRAMC